MPEAPNPKLRPTPQPTEERFAPDALRYAELDVTTNFSFLRGASHADELMLRAARLGYHAIAVTDINTLAGVVRMYDAARQIKATGWGPKLIIGGKLVLRDFPDLLVWPIDRAAYARLCRLLTLGRRRAPKGECELYIDDFLEHQQGLLAAMIVPANHRCEDESIANSQSEISHFKFSISNSESEISNFQSQIPNLQFLRNIMGDRLSVAASFAYGQDDEIQVAQLAELSSQTRVPMLATNAVHYHDPTRRPLQDVLTCIRCGCTIHEAGYRLFPNAERYLKTPAQMHRLFADYPRAIQRGIDIANQCNFSLDELRYQYPDEIVPPGQTPMQYLTQLAWEGAKERYPDGIPPKVESLIERELILIHHLNFPAYFLTVYDLVRFARSRGILCQGRGSAANSAVCYCIGVTSVDPSRIDVLFERFISAARNEPPDIDIDFEHERREEVIQYIYKKYGRERAGMTATVITYRGRSAVRDVGKAMGFSLDWVDQLAGKLDWWQRGTITPAQLLECGIDPTDLSVRQIITLTQQILGFPRHLSQHTGGMVMTQGLLCEMVPIENASMDDRTVIEWDKDDIDTLGLLKVDVLALGMLSCIARALKLLDPPLQLHEIPPEDPAVYDMICKADTIGVFQIESRAQMSMLPRLRPRCFYDLVIEVAIVRPGPIQGNMVHPYLRRRNGLEKVTFPSEGLREVLGKTLGVPLFQEQAMRVAMVGAGFSGEEADRLRRAMAAWKKRNGEIEKFHIKIVEGMTCNGYTAEFAEQSFEQIRGFAEYGFPESHSASFALLVYVSAWIKCHHPAEFACALLNSQPMGFYAPAQIVRDARDHGVIVQPVDVNESDWDCTLEEQAAGSGQRAAGGKQAGGSGQQIREESLSITNHQSPFQISNFKSQIPCLRLGLRQIKGLREESARRIVMARRMGGRFETIEQLQRRAGLSEQVIRRLAEADAFGSIHLKRRPAVWQTLALSDEQYPLFEQAATDAPAGGIEPTEVFLPPMSLGQEVMTDYATAGLSLKSHPVKLVRKQLTENGILTATGVNHLRHNRFVKVAGLVLIRQRPGTASGIVFITLEDETGIVNLIIRSEVFEKYRSAARHASLLQADGYLERQGQVVHVMATRLTDISSLLGSFSVPSRDFH